MICMSGVGARAQDRGEPAARRHAQRRQQRRSAVVLIVGHEEPIARRELEAGNVHGKPERVSTELPGQGAIALAALEAGPGAHCAEIRSELPSGKHGGKVADPMPEPFGEAAGDNRLVREGDVRTDPWPSRSDLRRTGFSITHSGSGAGGAPTASASNPSFRKPARHSSPLGDAAGGCTGPGWDGAGGRCSRGRGGGSGAEEAHGGARSATRMIAAVQAG